MDNFKDYQSKLCESAMNHITVDDSIDKSGYKLLQIDEFRVNRSIYPTRN